ncbi:MAG: DUF1801 domain-containing protein [Emcibacteraceae bacterium]|nr:DUF1801 domain-containing protein [Emcibacteraceae bacterium]
MVSLKNLNNDNLIAVFDRFPVEMREKLLKLREIIIEEAIANTKVGEIEESLKWGQPSYVPLNGSGSPIRLGVEKKSPGKFGLYVSCNTNLIETFKHIYPDQFNYSGNRAVLFSAGSHLPENELRHIINIALTYHLK